MSTQTRTKVEDILWPCTECFELIPLGQLFETDTWDVFCSACVAEMD